jgi:hypothetical protein
MRRIALAVQRGRRHASCSGSWSIAPERLAQAKEPLVVALPGGGHDLSGALAKHAPEARYVQLTVDAYLETSGGR